MSTRPDTPLPRQISLLIQEAIKKGILNEGDRLPPERELMNWFSVSRGTLRTALSELVDEQYIVTSQGRGNFVRRPPQQQKLTFLALESFRTDKLTQAPLHYGWIDQAGKSVNARIHYHYAPVVEELVETLKNPPPSYDGLLIFRAVPDWSSTITTLPDVLFEQCPLPVLILGRTLRKKSVNTVSWNYFDATYQATHKLIQLGHTRIGFVGGKPVPGHSFQDFYNGYRQALKDAQLPFRKQDVFFREGPLGVHLETSNQQMGDFLKQRHFSAVVVSLITDPFITVCKQHDIYYPRDLSVIFAGEEDAMVRLGDTWAGFAEPSSKVVERGLQVLAQTCRGMLSRDHCEILAPQWHPGPSAQPL